MKLFVFDDKKNIYTHILDKNNIESKTLLLPTGTTPLGLYNEIIKRKIDFSNIITFNLDEYYKIEKDNCDSYHYYMFNNLFKHTNILPENIHLLDGNTDNIVDECIKYSNLIKEYPIDIAFLGIGINGHIAFNEPGCDINSTTRLIDLTDETKNVNQIKYNKALSVGISEILSSKKIIILATGKTKTNIIYDLINCIEPKNDLPASYLINHSNVDLYIDNDAFSNVLHYLSPTFMNYNKILIFSPHPDDDVIGMGASIKKFIECGKDVTIVYQTSGSNGGNTLIRQEESINALKILGLHNKTKIIFGDTPFYNNKKIIVNNEDDVKYTLNIIKNINPDVIFFAGDTCDPHKTHLICNEIIQKCLKHLSSVKSSIDAYNYYSAWYSPPSNEYTHKEYFNKDLMDLKIESIKAHVTQLNPLFSGDLNIDFYSVVEKRNKSNSQQEFCDIYLEGFTLFIY